MTLCFVRFAVRRRSLSLPLSAACLVLAPIIGQWANAGAQLVTPKTVPLHQDDQFAIFPSSHPAIGVSIALDDTLADPFSNPAKATRVRNGAVFASFGSHSLTAGHGGGQTLPVGGLTSVGSWAGGAVFAVQELKQGPSFTQAISDRTASNHYVMGTLAKRVSNGLSIGASAYVAALGAVDAVDLLYAGSDRIEQSGTLADFRLGLTKDWAQGRRFDFVVVHNRTSLTQDVHYHTFVRWDTVTHQQVFNDRTDDNLDHTNIWGSHSQFVMPFGEDGFRLGFVATANRLDHPKIPNYQLQSIPRDPGATYAYNVGIGVGRTVGLTTFGIDVIDEPMYSHTWGTAGGDTSVAGFPAVRAGNVTVDNHFDFSNSRIRLGVAQAFPIDTDTSTSWGFELGLDAYSINYHLRQTNYVRGGALRTQDEGWTEWTPSFGLRWRSKALEVRYTYQRTCGPSECADLGFGDKVTVPPATTGGIIAAPSSPLTINGGTASMHRLGVVVPMR
jgi:hypothetical protein